MSEPAVTFTDSDLERWRIDELAATVLAQADAIYELKQTVDWLVERIKIAEVHGIGPR